MTYREFYNNVKAIDGISTEMVEFADKAIKAIDQKNANRKNGNSKSAQEAQAERKLILDAIADGQTYTAKQVADICEFKSTQKASGILGQLVKEEKVCVKDFSPTGKKKDTVKGYYVEIAE